MGLHNSWGAWDGGKLGYMGSAVGVWAPPTQGAWEGRRAHLLALPSRVWCPHSLHFIRILVTGLTCWMLGNHGELGGLQLNSVVPRAAWGEPGLGTSPRGSAFQKAGLSTVPEARVCPRPNMRQGSRVLAGPVFLHPSQHTWDNWD